MTIEEKKKIYAALSAPFPEHCIQRTEGRITGRGYDTTGIGYAFITARLNEVVGLGNWRAHRTVTVKPIARSNGRAAFEAICDITLELGEWVDGCFVAWAEALSDGGHVASSEADARKGAYTNALKKAAAMFGCGRQAYEGTLDDDNLPNEQSGEGVTIETLPTPTPQQVRAVAAPAPVQQPQQMPQPPRPPSNPRNRLTSKQLSAIWAIGRKLGYDQGQLRSFIKQTFNTQPEFLTREQASQIIGTMSAKAGNGNGQDHHPAEPGMEG
jgi:hypothetical protein